MNWTEIVTSALDSTVISTFLWVALIAVGYLLLGDKVQEFVGVITDRFRKGAGGKIGPLEVEQDLTSAGSQDPANSKHAEKARELADAPHWTQERIKIGKSQRGVHLAHVVLPTDEPGQKFELLVYLVPGAERESRYGKPDDLGDVALAEFFLGHMWGNKVTPVRWTPGRRYLGIRTTAYAPAICLCRVTFTGSGETVLLSRFLDFEMGRLVDKTAYRDHLHSI
jgi:hypothetical protein